MTDKPCVLFICVKNGGKSQMAAALARQQAGGVVEVYSAGTRPGAAINAESAAAIAEVGADMSGEVPRPIDEDILRRADRVIVLGSEAQVDEVPGMVASIETWTTDEPSSRGIEGAERMRLIRDDIGARVTALIAELNNKEKS